MKIWRRLAQAAAKLKGGKRACDICKRAIDGKSSLTIRLPWQSFSFVKRWLCSEHYVLITEYVAELERTSDNYDLPIDRVGGRSTKGNRQRGTFVER